MDLWWSQLRDKFMCIQWSVVGWTRWHWALFHHSIDADADACNERWLVTARVYCAIAFWTLAPSAVTSVGVTADGAVGDVLPDAYLAPMWEQPLENDGPVGDHAEDGCVALRVRDYAYAVGSVNACVAAFRRIPWLHDRADPFHFDLQTDK